MGNSETYVSVEVALGAKNLGFNWPVNTYYKKNKPGSKSKYMKGTVIRKNITNARLVISRPTQDLLHKWLRETYNMYISVVPVYPSMWSITIYHSMDLFRSKKDNWEHNSYEEALEEGLMWVINYLEEQKFLNL